MKIYDTVEDLLRKYPKLRDSDRLLIWNVWGMSGKLDDTGYQTYIKKRDFMNAPSPESIRRCRQKLQEKYPELRSSKQIQAYKNKKAQEKGTFIYREHVN